jgi:hypothetical protein
MPLEPEPARAGVRAWPAIAAYAVLFVVLVAVTRFLWFGGAFVESVFWAAIVVPVILLLRAWASRRSGLDRP